MDAIVIGAGPTGLAVAACLGAKGLGVRVLERADGVASAWRGHYDSLRLHTARDRSGLPMMPMPKSFPVFPTRAQVIGYFEDYAARFVPDIAFGAEVTSVTHDGGRWRVAHSGGEERARIVVFATGLNGTPNRPTWPGIEGFPGPVLHSSDYGTPADISGDRVLVVGFGNSGGDIALDLADAGRHPEISVRGPVNILPLRLFGLPTTSLGLLPKLVGYRMADRITAPVLRLVIGRPSDYGLPEPEKGPVAQVVEDGKVPLIDHGALPAIRAGRIGVRTGIARFEGAEAVFTDGSRAAYDAVLLATGYHVDLRPILGEASPALTPEGVPRFCGGPSGAEGLYFASYVASTEGQLRQSGFDARAIAEHAAGRLDSAEG